MHIFINTLSDPATIIGFSNTKEILDIIQWDAKGKEYETLVEKIEELCKKQSLTLSQIKSITAVNGPG